MSGAGDFRTRLMLQAPVEIGDGQGGMTRSYADVRKVWAKVTPLAARENVVADDAGAAQRVRIETRAPLALSLRHRLVDGGAIYRIASYRSDEGFVVIEAETQIL